MLFCLCYPPLLSSNTFCVFLCFLLSLHVYLLSSPIFCSSPSNPFFVTTSYLAPLPCTVVGRKSYLPFLAEKWRLIVSNNVLITPHVHFRTELDEERAQGNGIPAWQPGHRGSLSHGTLTIYTAILNDFLVITPVLLLVCRGFLKMIFVEERSQLHPFKCLFQESKHAPSRHRPSSSLCQV